MKKIILLGTIVALVMSFFFYFLTSRDIEASTIVNCPPRISAKDAILINGQNGQILFEKNCEEKAYPASTTKIMTALVALKICTAYHISLDEKVIIPGDAIGVEGSSIYLKKGEKKTIRQLLYGAMLRSGNDSATALAITLGGSEKSFVRLMNEEARRIGCHNTHFVNPTGLHNEDHYTTARDLAYIAKDAMSNKDFRKIVGVKRWGNFSNKNKTIYQYKGATGVKIGFTKIAGRTLVASAKRDEQEYIAVVLADGNWFNDAYALLDYGFKMGEE